MRSILSCSLVKSISSYLRYRHYRFFSRSAFSTALPITHPIYAIWAANTGLGKTLVSAGLAASTVIFPKPSKFLYVKPIQTGFPTDSDSRFVYAKTSQLFLCRNPSSALSASNHIIETSSAVMHSEERGEEMKHMRWYEERMLGRENAIKSELICKTLFSWKEAVSPHLAAEREGETISDLGLLEMLQNCLEMASGESGNMDFLTVVETAGGVASPGPSGSLQCDLYRPFRLPAILVGDGRLGGISTTISAYESLKVRGYDVVVVIIADCGLANEVPLSTYLRNRIPVFVLPPVPQDQSDDLMQWFDDSQDVFNSIKEIMLSAFSERTKRFREMPKRARDIFWWPFTQHRLIPQETVTVIDSRCGENFSVYTDRGAITEQFDACASWWTQGPNAALQIELARDMGYAAARFGHVMFPENVYDPALECAELLLGGVGKGWASRTFFSDNGSTAIEIALKMAFRKFCLDHGILSDFLKASTTKSRVDLKVLALKGCYHGDTLGAMEAQAPSSFTGFLQQPWYSGRGLFLDPPTVFLCNRRWLLSLPKDTSFENLKLENITFSSRDEIFDKSRDSSGLNDNYKSYISQHLSQCPETNGVARIGALILEPVVQAAGGMHMVDPLFQRVLAKECRKRNIPIIYDEVFTGFWRLGVETAAELLGSSPDIACFGKLMTGGVIPLAATLATNDIFDAFNGDSKLRALLHGHSYSAHAMGCTAAAKSIRWFKDPMTNLNLSSERGCLNELWDMELVGHISSHPAVQRVVALGTLCAIELRAEGSNAGYASLYANSLVRKLREDGVYMRPLGNVIYLMCGPCTLPSSCDQVLNKVNRSLGFSQLKD